MSSGAMKSNVGNSQVYNDGDQRHYSRQEMEDRRDDVRFEEGQPNSHQLNDSKDERSLSNRAAAEKKADMEEAARDREASQQDPRAPAMRHGNQPSRGAEIDADLKAADEETLRAKGKA